jgi:hypothetical protein
MVILIASLFLTVIACGCLESESLISGQATDKALSVEDFPENWIAYNYSDNSWTLTDNYAEFNFLIPGEYHEYKPPVRIRISIYDEDVTLSNGTVLNPIQLSEWIYDVTMDDHHEILPLDLGEEGYYYTLNYTYQEDQYTQAIYSFRMKNVWVWMYFDINASHIPYWGWIEDMVRLQESRILG